MKRLMRKATNILWGVIVLTLSGAPAAAQTTRNIFLDVNAGIQIGAPSFVVDAVQTVYAESAIISGTHDLGVGFLFDVSAGYRVWRDLSIGLGFASIRTSSPADVTAAIPHPLFHDRRVEVNFTTDDLNRSERVLYIPFTWNVPFTDKMDASFGFGPAFIFVNQELVAGVEVPAGTQDALPAVEEQSDTAFGFHIGADLTYLLTPRYGVGGFLRYLYGAVGLPSVDDATLGGFQLGGGLRVRF